MIKLTIHCDGGARGNPGPAALGLVIYNEKEEIIKTYKEYLGTTTNNVAEYKSLIKALELAIKFNPKETKVYMDSELVINQMNGKYRVKAQHLKPLNQKVKELAKKFESITFSQVPRAKARQSKADELVNQALDEIH